MNLPQLRKYSLRALLAGLPLAFYAGVLLHKVNLTTADLGRHIQNGRLLFADHSVLFANFYSYTMPSYPVINHHWGFGLIVSFLEKLGGIDLIHIAFIVLSLITFLVFYRLAAMQANLGIATLVSLLMIFLLAERTEIRPEALSYFFIGVFLWALFQYRNARVSKKWLLLLPFSQIIWVNTHIFFIFGPILVAAFLLERLLVNRTISRPLSLFLFLTVLASMVNPFGLRALGEPFTILEQFGYRLAENQTVFFMWDRAPTLVLWAFVFLFFTMLLSFLVLAFMGRRRIPLVNVFLFAGFSFLAWYQIRNISLFGLVMIPILSQNSHLLFARSSAGRFRKLALVLGLMILVIAASGNLLHLFPYWHEFGIGLESYNNDTADFLKINNIQGPIFNNYDIGGYLIYHLSDREKVFVDNRPEAYSVEFFEDTYIPMQDDPARWQGELEKYDFNAIVFSHRDATPWGQKFLIARAQDGEWVPVFADNYGIIFLRQNEVNRSLIERFGL